MYAFSLVQQTASCRTEFFFCSHLSPFYKNYNAILLYYNVTHKNGYNDDFSQFPPTTFIFTHTHTNTLPLIFTCVHWHVISQNIPTGYVLRVEVFNYSRRNCPLPRCRSTNYYGPKCLYHFQITVLSTVYEHHAITLIPFMLKRNTHEQQKNYKCDLLYILRALTLL